MDQEAINLKFNMEFDELGSINNPIMVHVDLPLGSIISTLGQYRLLKVTENIHRLKPGGRIGVMRLGLCYSSWIKLCRWAWFTKIHTWMSKFDLTACFNCGCVTRCKPCPNCKSDFEV